MNPYGDGPNQGQYPGGPYPQPVPPQPGHPQGGYPPGPPQQATQQFPPGYGYQQPAPQPPNGGGGGRRGLVVGLTAVVVVLAVAAAIGVGLSLRDGGETGEASPVTFSTVPTTAGAPTTAAPTTGATTPAPQSDGFLTTTPPTSAGGVSYPVKLKAGGTGTGIVTLVGAGPQVPAPGTTLPWEWQGFIALGDEMTMVVTGTGTVTCSIAVDGRELSTKTGTGTVKCGIVRKAAP